ncbi:MAG: ATP-dependent metallopeptidase FtsH/Yme1/Tma family protein [Cellulosilyticaceae bacterium]
MINKHHWKKYMPYLIGALILCLILIGSWQNKYNKKPYITYPAFEKKVEAGQIKQVVLKESTHIEFWEVGDGQAYTTDHPRTFHFKEWLLKNNIKVIESNVGQELALIQYLVSGMLFMGVFYVVFQSVRHRGSGGGMMALQVTPMAAEDLKVGFRDMAGNTEAKEQVEDVIKFMKHPEKYLKLGARMPKGLIFYGPPGTGKTLMAKAIAKEAGVPFFSVSGSDFVQMYVGVGASRIREIFKEARKTEKAVIFIDEIDAIGKARGQSATNSNDEKDQTLNALLTEMSGFKKEDGIVVIAATNRLELLDEALLRPGRFDRHIEIGYPDKSARKQIIKLYLKDKPIGESIEVEEWVGQTAYFTGAMLENLINEAAISAANEEAPIIEKHHMEKAFYTVVAGAQKKDRSYISEDERRITAYHEAGHALMTKLVAPENSVAKVTIIPTAKGAGGFSMNIPKDKMYHTKKDFLHQIQISLAGRIAEELVFGKDCITTGASNDIEKATQYLKDYVEKYGMDDQVGFLNMRVLGMSESISSEKLLETYQQLMQMLYEKSVTLLEEHRSQLELIAETLLKEETLDEKALDALLEI